MLSNNVRGITCIRSLLHFNPEFSRVSKIIYAQCFHTDKATASRFVDGFRMDGIAPPNNPQSYRCPFVWTQNGYPIMIHHQHNTVGHIAWNVVQRSVVRIWAFSEHVQRSTDPVWAKQAQRNQNTDGSDRMIIEVWLTLNIVIVFRSYSLYTNLQIHATLR